VRIKVRCYAKLNLYLDITGKRPDGFHDILTIFQPVAIWDEINVTRDVDGITLHGDDPDIPWNEENLCFRSAELLFKRFNISSGVNILVKKKIPSGAGLGGASADAAGVLIALNRLFELDLDKSELRNLALEIGSDVPFFIFGSPAIGMGRGELLEGWSGLEDGRFLLVKPDITISTSWAYSNINLQLTTGLSKSKLKSVLERIGKLPDRPVETYNAFEALLRETYPVIEDILDRLKRNEPLICSVSGSGSTCFALFSEEERAKEVEREFIKNGYSTWIVEPVNSTIKLLQ